MASTIIADKAIYQSHLAKFLAPAVGNDSKWLLCYRASSHGWDVSNFHNRCDGKRNTVTIMKVGVYVFGGYTDIPWGKYNYLVLIIIIIIIILLFLLLLLLLLRTYLSRITASVLEKKLLSMQVLLLKTKKDERLTIMLFTSIVLNISTCDI